MIENWVLGIAIAFSSSRTTQFEIASLILEGDDMMRPSRVLWRLLVVPHDCMSFYI